MTTKTIAASAVLIAVLFAGLLLFATQPARSPITVRYIKSIQTAKCILAIFEIRNETASPYAVIPLEVEALNGQTWQRCFFFVEQLSSPSVIYLFRDVVAPHGCASRHFGFTNLPPETPLRLRLIIDRELTGAHGFWERVKERYLYQHAYMSLNPSDRHTFVFDRNLYQITSEEFTEPKR